MPQARGLQRRPVAEVFNDRGEFQARVALTGSVRPALPSRPALLEQAVSGRGERQQHNLLGTRGHGGRGDVL